MFLILAIPTSTKDWSPVLMPTYADFGGWLISTIAGVGLLVTADMSDSECRGVRVRSRGLHVQMNSESR